MTTPRGPRAVDVAALARRHGVRIVGRTSWAVVADRPTMAPIGIELAIIGGDAYGRRAVSDALAGELAGQLAYRGRFTPSRLMIGARP